MHSNVVLAEHNYHWLQKLILRMETVQKMLQKLSTLLLCLILIAVGAPYIKQTSGNDVRLNVESHQGVGWKKIIELEQQEMLNRAHHLLNLYFEGDVIIKESEAGPGNTLIVKAKVAEVERHFILLGDKDHLIEGTIYSPYMTSQLVTESHSKKGQEIAIQNDLIARSVEENKSRFFKAQKSNSSMPAANSGSSKEQFKIPERNSIFGQDKKLQLFKHTEDLEYIEFGNNSAPLIYVFFDFNCAGCRVTEKVLKKYTANGSLRVRYIPVGVISEESPLKAAYSIIPKENEKRKLVFELFGQSKKFADLVSKTATEQESKKAFESIITANRLFMTLPKPVTPTFVYRHKNAVSIGTVTSEAGIRRIINQLKG